MKDSDTRKFLFFVPRADQFDEQYTADIQSNGLFVFTMQQSCSESCTTPLTHLDKLAGSDDCNNRHGLSCLVITWGVL